MSSVGPLSTSRPWRSTVMPVGELRDHGEVVGDVEARRAMSAQHCVIAASTSICVVTSSAVVGSSRTRSSGSQHIAIAIMARCSWPPET